MSYAEFESSVLIAIIDNYAERRRAEIMIKKEEYIAYEMKTGGWFGAPISREKALKNLANDIWSHYHSLNENMPYELKELRKLAYNTSGTVYVSSKFAYIFN